jgi:hypothetical protein
MRLRISHLDAERQCRRFCRPVRTGLGEVAIRPIGPADAGIAQAFVTGLSGTSRYCRFFQALKCLSPAMLDSFTGVDQVTHMALAGVADIDGTPTMVAEARYAADAEGAAAEIAMVVADHTRLTGECLAVNAGFASLARSVGFQVHSDPNDRSLLQIDKHIGGDAGRRGTTPRRFHKGGADAIASAMS